MTELFIIHSLAYQKVAAQWIPRLLIDEPKKLNSVVIKAFDKSIINYRR